MICWLTEAGIPVDVVWAGLSGAGREAARSAVEVELGRTGVARVARVGTDVLAAFHDAFADAALLLGPLYHLVELKDRLGALREARRVSRSGGVVVAAAISRFAPLLDAMDRELYTDPALHRLMVGDLHTGRHTNPTGDPRYFTTAYLHRPEELRDEFEAAGLHHIATLAVEGPACLLEDIEERWTHQDRRELLLEAIRQIETEPALLGMTSHLLAIGTAG